MIRRQIYLQGWPNRHAVMVGEAEARHALVRWKRYRNDPHGLAASQTLRAECLPGIHWGARKHVPESEQLFRCAQEITPRLLRRSQKAEIKAAIRR